ncbi:MAG: TIGR04013 family B12-binding domain/radical SAM domain-containing protein [Elusimicrobiales bacterium]|nr:TIGR04013 family B12-binding domain/radical SAM domain-containing protein [Elusimicrobiales bacterium]
MRHTPSLIFRAARENKLSVCALCGAMETRPELDDWVVLRPKSAADFFQAVSAHAGRARPCVAAFSFFTGQARGVYAEVARLKRDWGDAVFCAAGGAHAGALPLETLEAGFDAVVVGEGEAAFPELLCALAGGGEWRKIRGLAFIDGGKLRLNPKPAPAVLDAYPPVSFRQELFGAIEITRGCPNACSFCRTSGHFGTAMRHRGADVICGFAGRLAKRGLGHFRAVTPDAFAYGSPDGKTVNLAALEELLSKLSAVMKPSGGKVFYGSFPSEVRPEHVTPQTIALVKRFCDNDNLVIGAQTASPRLLEKCRRGHSVDDFMRAAELTLAAGLKASVDFIFGLPGETQEDARLTIAALEALTARGARIHAHTFMPLPGTAFAAERPAPTLRLYSEVINRLNGRGLLFGDWMRQRSGKTGPAEK